MVLPHCFTNGVAPRSHELERISKHGTFAVMANQGRFTSKKRCVGNEAAQMSRARPTPAVASEAASTGQDEPSSRLRPCSKPPHRRWLRLGFYESVCIKRISGCKPKRWGLARSCVRRRSEMTSSPKLATASGVCSPRTVKCDMPSSI